MDQNPYLTEGLVAHWWGKIPSAFRGLSQDDRSEMMAIYMVHREVENYYEGERARRMESSIPSNNPRHRP